MVGQSTAGPPVLYPEDEAFIVRVVVELDEGPRMMSFLVDAEPDPDQIRCGIAVGVAQDGDGWSVPVFRCEPG